MISPSLIVNKTSNSSIAVYWSPFIKYDFPDISYKLQCCYFSSFNASKICTKIDAGLYTNYVFKDLLPNTTYDISLEVVSSVPVVCINSTITVKTNTGKLYNSFFPSEVVSEKDY